MSGEILEDKNGNVTRREKNKKPLTDRNTPPQSKQSAKIIKLQTQQQTLLMVELKMKKANNIFKLMQQFKVEQQTATKLSN